MRHGPNPGRRDRAAPLADPARMSLGGIVMRRLRVSLAGVVILSLLAGLGCAVLAQDPSTAPSEAATMSPEPALVTGTERCTSVDLSTSDEDGVTRGHIPLVECTNEASDPRVSGPSQGEFLMAC
jgi:hypothetical protein